MLKFPDFIKSFEVHTNASDFNIEGVPMQNGHPIIFESKKLCDGQFTKKKLYVVMCYLKTWQHYLGMHKTTWSLQIMPP
jgi:hypothetical protein